MNRKWLLGGLAAVAALAAVLALSLIGGGAVGRSLLSPAATTTPTPTTPTRPLTVRFVDSIADFGISYPSSWVRRQSGDSTVRLVAASPDDSAALSVSVRSSGLSDPVTDSTIGVVRPLTDDLLRADRRITKIGQPVGVRVSGLPGYRYQYTYRTAKGGHGAHVHFFLFNGKFLIQIVLQAVPASKISALGTTFERIAGTFELTKP
jgi:hypothetical protein